MDSASMQRIPLAASESPLHSPLEVNGWIHGPDALQICCTFLYFEPSATLLGIVFCANLNAQKSWCNLTWHTDLYKLGWNESSHEEDTVAQETDPPQN